MPCRVLSQHSAFLCTAAGTIWHRIGVRCALFCFVLPVSPLRLRETWGKKWVTYVCIFWNLACFLGESRCSVNTCEGNCIWSPKNSITMDSANKEGKMLPIQDKDNEIEGLVPKHQKYGCLCYFQKERMGCGSCPCTSKFTHVPSLCAHDNVQSRHSQFWLMCEEVDALEKAPN